MVVALHAADDDVGGQPGVDGDAVVVQAAVDHDAVAEIGDVVAVRNAGRGGVGIVGIRHDVNAGLAVGELRDRDHVEGAGARHVGGHVRFEADVGRESFMRYVRTVRMRPG